MEKYTITAEQFNELMAALEESRTALEELNDFPEYAEEYCGGCSNEETPECDTEAKPIEPNFSDVAATSQAIKAILYGKMKGNVDTVILEAIDHIVGALAQIAVYPTCPAQTPEELLHILLQQ